MCVEKNTIYLKSMNVFIIVYIFFFFYLFSKENFCASFKLLYCIFFFATYVYVNVYIAVKPEKKMMILIFTLRNAIYIVYKMLLI